MWSPKWKWLDKDKRLIEVTLSRFFTGEMEVGDDFVKYYDTPGCRCRPIIVYELNMMRTDTINCEVHS